MRASARRRRAEATSSNAFVIFCVLPTERIRRFKSWTVAICLAGARERPLLHGEGLGDLLDLLAELLLDLVGEHFFLADRVVDRVLRTEVLAQLLLEALHLVGRDLVEEALVAGEDR